MELPIVVKAVEPAVITTPTLDDGDARARDQAPAVQLVPRARTI